MRNQYQENLSSLRRSFEAVPRLAVAAVRFEYEAGKYDSDCIKTDYPELAGALIEGPSVTRMFGTDDLSLPLIRRHYLVFEDDTSLWKYKDAASAASISIKRWALGYGITENTVKHSRDVELWTDVLFDLLDKPHPAYPRTERIGFVDGNERAMEIQFSCLAENRNMTGVERTEASAFGVYARITDVAHASEQAIDRLTKYDAAGNLLLHENAATRTIRKNNASRKGIGGRPAKYAPETVKACKKLVDEYKSSQNRQRCNSLDIGNYVHDKLELLPDEVTSRFANLTDVSLSELGDVIRDAAKSRQNP